MNKQEFLDRLRKGLSGLPQRDTAEHLTFYSEMIDDRIEEGYSEEDAVAAVGSVPEIITQILTDYPIATLAKERFKPNRRLKAWEIILLALGSPIWFSLGIAALAVLFSIYVSIWSVIIALWAVFVSIIASSLGCIVAGIIFITGGIRTTGIAVIGAGLVCAGLSVFIFIGCTITTKGILVLTKKISLWIKNRFVKKEAA